MRVSIGAVTLTSVLVALATPCWAEHAGAPRPAALKSGDTFADCTDGCPLMVVMPAGAFVMGSSRYAREQPQHTVAFRRPFAVGRFAVTRTAGTLTTRARPSTARLGRAATRRWPSCAAAPGTIADRNWYPKSGSTSFIGFRLVTPLDETIAMLGE